MQIQPFPSPPPQYQTGFMARVLEALRVNFGNVVGKTEAVPALYLLSPAGKVYRITVTDNGVVTSTYVSG